MILKLNAAHSYIYANMIKTITLLYNRSFMLFL